MLPIQPVVVDDVDEELAAAGVRTRVRHGDGASRISVVRGKLILDRVPRAAKPGPLRVPTLDHEVRDHAMEDRSIVEALRDELPEVARRDRHCLSRSSIFTSPIVVWRRTVVMRPPFVPPT